MENGRPKKGDTCSNSGPGSFTSSRLGRAREREEAGRGRREADSLTEEKRERGKEDERCTVYDAKRETSVEWDVSVRVIMPVIHMSFIMHYTVTCFHKTTIMFPPPLELQCMKSRGTAE